jgi:hypothetical protein
MLGCLHNALGVLGGLLPLDKSLDKGSAHDPKLNTAGIAVVQTDHLMAIQAD